MSRAINTLQWMIIATILAVTTPFALAAETIVLSEGQSQVVNTAFPVTKIATGNPQIARGVLVSEQEVLINAQTVGSTNILLLGDENQSLTYNIEVTSSEASLLEEELQGLVNGMSKVTVRKVGRKVVLEGEVLSVKDLDKINTIVENMPDVINLIKLNPIVQNVRREEIQNALRKEGIVGVTIQVVNENFMLMGVVPDESAHHRATIIASAFAPKIINAISIDAENRPDVFTTIEMQLSIIEIEKNMLKDLGIHWNPLSTSEATGSYTDGSNESSNLGTSITGTISDLFPKMKRIFDKGKGRSLIEQSITAKSGEKADFFVGTQYPILVPQEGGILSAEYKDIGVRMEMQPTLRNDNFINSPINIESTAITGETSNGMPILSSSTLNTIMNLVDNTSVAIAGLISRKEIRDIIDSPPSGTDLSLIQLNSGESKEDDTRQVLIFITPRIIDYYDEATQKMGQSIEDDFKKIELQALRKAYKEQ